MNDTGINETTEPGLEPVIDQPQAADTPGLEDGGPLEQQAQINLYANAKGIMLEARFPTGEIDEKNMLHVLAWYVQQYASALIPDAARIWHVHRTAMNQQAPVKGDDAPAPELLQAPSAIIGADGRPL